MDFSLNLFSDGDWKKLEDTLFRAMVRASRVMAREGSVTGFKPPAETTVVPPEAPPREPHPAFRAPEPMKSPPRPGPAHVVQEPARAALPEGRKRASPVSLSKIIKTVEHRPHGWIERQEAQALLGSTVADKTALSQWIREREVPAVIVTNVKGPPTKGLPGRVHVDKEALLKRQAAREAAVTEMQRVGSGKVGKMYKEAKREKQQAAG